LWRQVSNLPDAKGKLKTCRHKNEEHQTKWVAGAPAALERETTDDER
jgi:hypothetical protein